MRNVRTLLTFLLGWPLSLIALYFLGKTFLTQLTKIQTNLTSINWILLSLSIVLFVAYFFLRSYIWYKILVYRGHTLDARESIFQWSFAQLKRYIPGNIWGVVGVSVHFGKKNVSKKEIASSFITESQLVLLSAAFLSLFGLSLLFQSLHIIEWLPVTYWVAGGLILFGTIVYFHVNYIIQKIPKIPRFIKYVLPAQKPNELFFLWLLMSVALALYGFGTYFAISSLVYLDINAVFSISAYFVLSLLIGFLSVITPSGLGVREGAIVLGLTQFISSGVAAFAALFARLLLIVGELVFIGLSLALHKVRSGWWGRGVSLVMKHPYETVLTILYGIFVGYFSLISFLRYDHYYTGRFDLGNMVQTVWNTTQGRIFEFTNPDSVHIVSRLAFHADFILVLFAPFYLLWQDPRMLLLLQAFITGAGIFFVYLLARDILHSKAIALTLGLLFILNPSVQRAVIYDFHAVTLATTFLLGAFYFLYKKKYWWFALFAVLAALTKEQIWAIIALFGLYIAFVQQQRKLGLSIFGISVLIVYLLLWHLIPHFAGSSGHFALSYYNAGENIDSPSALIKSYLSSPEKLWAIITDEARQSYVNKLLSPLGYVSLFAPLFLIFTLPDLTINLLSAKPQLHQIYYQYTAAITPFLFIATIFGIAFIRSRVKRLPEIAIVLYFIIIGSYTAYLYGPLPQSREPNLDMITKPMANKDTLDALLADIPAEYSVATSNSLGSHLAHRRYLFTVPYGWDDADFVIFSMRESYAYPTLDAHKEQIKKLENNPLYIKYFDDGTILAFRKVSIKL